MFKKKFRKASIVLAASMMTLSPVVPCLSTSAYAATKTRLDAPTDVCWTDKKGEDEGSYASWGSVENAKQYEVYLYYENDNEKMVKLADVKTKNTTINLRNKMAKEADYSFRVRAIGSGKYTTSNWSDYSEAAYFEKYSKPTAVTTVTTGTTSSAPTNSFSNAGNASVQNPAKTSTNISEKAGPGALISNGGGTWKQKDGRWWYATNQDGTVWYSNGWQWVDGNHDGTAECYYFDKDGYAVTNGTTPDGYTVNADGAWEINGTVQAKHSK